MGHLTIFNKNQKTQVIKTTDAFEREYKQDKSRPSTKDEIYNKCKSIGNDIMGVNYAGHSFVSGL